MEQGRSQCHASGSVFVTGFSGASNSGDWSSTDWVTVKYVTRPSSPPTPEPHQCGGTTASLTVEAVGGLPLSYQWYRDGTNLVDGGNLSWRHHDKSGRLRMCRLRTRAITPS